MSALWLPSRYGPEVLDFVVVVEMKGQTRLRLTNPIILCFSLESSGPTIPSCSYFVCPYSLILTERPLFLLLVADPGTPYSINIQDLFFLSQFYSSIYPIHNGWLLLQPFAIPDSLCKRSI